MGDIGKESLLVVFLVLGLCVSIVNVVSADGPVADISVEPLEPEPLSTVSFTANITSEEAVDEVYIKIKECTQSLCFSIKNVSMEFDGDGYSVDFTLEHSDATYFDYWLEIKSGDSWFTTEQANVTLKIEASNENDNDNGNTGGTEEDNNDGIPGFEILIFIVAVFIALIFFRRKRL